MTRKPTQTTAKSTTSRSRPDRQSITFELVARLAPHQGLADNLVRTFGLEPVDYDGIRDSTQEHITPSRPVAKKAHSVLQGRVGSSDPTPMVVS